MYFKWFRQCFVLVNQNLFLVKFKFYFKLSVLMKIMIPPIYVCPSFLVVYENCFCLFRVTSTVLPVNFVSRIIKTHKIPFGNIQAFKAFSYKIQKVKIWTSLSLLMSIASTISSSFNHRNFRFMYQILLLLLGIPYQDHP